MIVKANSLEKASLRRLGLMSEQVLYASPEEISDAMVNKFLNSLYDEMMLLNKMGLFGKDFPWLHLNLSVKDYVGFSNDPEKWAKDYLKRLNNSWGVE